MLLLAIYVLAPKPILEVNGRFWDVCSTPFFLILNKNEPLCWDWAKVKLISNDAVNL